MAATSVTGVGPRWDEKKEQKFNLMYRVVFVLAVLQACSLGFISYLLWSR